MPLRKRDPARYCPACTVNAPVVDTSVNIEGVAVVQRGPYASVRAMNDNLLVSWTFMNSVMEHRKWPVEPAGRGPQLLPIGAQNSFSSRDAEVPDTADYEYARSNLITPAPIFPHRQVSQLPFTHSSSLDAIIPFTSTPPHKTSQLSRSFDARRHAIYIAPNLEAPYHRLDAYVSRILSLIGEAQDGQHLPAELNIPALYWGIILRFVDWEEDTDSDWDATSGSTSHIPPSLASELDLEQDTNITQSASSSPHASPSLPNLSTTSVQWTGTSYIQQHPQKLFIAPSNPNIIPTPTRNSSTTPTPTPTPTPKHQIKPRPSRKALQRSRTRGPVAYMTHFSMQQVHTMGTSSSPTDSNANISAETNAGQGEKVKAGTDIRVDTGQEISSPPSHHPTDTNDSASDPYSWRANLAALFPDESGVSDGDVRPWTRKGRAVEVFWTREGLGLLIGRLAGRRM